MTKISKTLFCLVAGLYLVTGLAGCGTLEGESLDSGLNMKLGVPATRKIAQSPPEVYTRLASQVHACWLGGEAPLLPGYQFFAEAPPGNSEARILLHQQPKADDKKRGRLAYVIKMKPVMGGTVVSTDAYRIASLNQQDEMQRAVVMWAHGASECDAGSQQLSTEEIAAAAAARKAAGVSTSDKTAGKPAVAKKQRMAELPPLPVRRPYRKYRSKKRPIPVASTAKPKAKAAPKVAARSKVKAKPPTMRGAVKEPQTTASTSAVRIPGVRKISFEALPKAKKAAPKKPAVRKMVLPTSAPKPKPKTVNPPVISNQAMAPMQVMPISVADQMRKQAARKAAAEKAKADKQKKLPGQHMFLESKPAFAGQ